MQTSHDKPLRLLVVVPSWLGDAVMATPALRILRRALPGAFIGALVRPGIDQLLAGSDLFDELHVARSTGVMGPKVVAQKIRPRRYDTAVLMPNSFSSALVARIAGIPRRLGYARDARGLLLTASLRPPQRADGAWAITPAVDYYYTLIAGLVLREGVTAAPPPSVPIGAAPTEYDRRPQVAGQFRLPPGCSMELPVTDADEHAAREILARANLGAATPASARLAVLNPGGNNEAKRWPADRFAALASWLHEHHGLTVVLNGSPAEAPLTHAIAAAAGVPTVNLPRLGITIGALKAIVRRASLMVTNDTGPRHIAAALGVPLVSLFGPTDHRWTLIPCRPPPTPAPAHACREERILTADPTLPESESANDHPDRCRIDRISLDRVREAAAAALSAIPLTTP